VKLPETKQEFAKKASLCSRIILLPVAILTRTTIIAGNARVENLGEWRFGVNMGARMAAQHGEKITKK
jgi:hypothetical protein